MKKSKWLPVVETLKAGGDIVLDDYRPMGSLLESLRNRGAYGRCEKLPRGGWRVWASNEPGKGGKRRKSDVVTLRA